MRIALLRQSEGQPTVKEQLNQGWDIVVGEDSSVKPFSTGKSFHVLFRALDDKGRIPDELKELYHWTGWGADGFMVFSQPADVVLSMLKAVFGEAQFFDASSNQEILVEDMGFLGGNRHG